MATSNVSVSRGDIFTAKKGKGILVNTGSRMVYRWTRLPGEFDDRFGGEISYFISKSDKSDLYFQKGLIDRKAAIRRDVITVIVKETEWESVDEQHLNHLLWKLREFCENNDIHQLIMPKLCCGVHGANWNQVLPMLRAVFNGSNIHVTVKIL